NARAKRNRKGCDWIVANDVSPGTGTFGGERNTVHLVDGDTVEDWPAMTKREVADRLAERIAAALVPGTAAAPASPRVPGAGRPPRPAGLHPDRAAALRRGRRVFPIRRAAGRRLRLHRDLIGRVAETRVRGHI